MTGTSNNSRHGNSYVGRPTHQVLVAEHPVQLVPCAKSPRPLDRVAVISGVLAPGNLALIRPDIYHPVLPNNGTRRETAITGINKQLWGDNVDCRAPRSAFSVPPRQPNRRPASSFYLLAHNQDRRRQQFWRRLHCSARLPYKQARLVPLPVLYRFALRPCETRGSSKLKLAGAACR